MPYSEKVKFIFTINACINHICPVGKILSSIVTSSTTSSSSSNIYYKNIYNELFSGFFNNNIEIVFWNIFVSLPLHTPWHRPLLAQPGPRREAIHCAFLSSFICASNLIATCLLPAASLAAGEIRPTLAKVHIACALTAHVETRRRYCPTIVPRRCSDLRIMNTLL